MSATAEAKTAVVCLCKHARDRHTDQGCTEERCECRRYWARPCRCGHRPEEHRSRCRSCDCKGFSADKSPEWLLRMRVKSGDWRTALKAHDRAFMQRGFRLATKVYAFLQSKSLGRGKRRIAIAGYRDGKPVAVQPGHILAALNKQETVEKWERSHISRALADLEAWGLIRLAGMPVRGHRIIGVYNEPRPPRPDPEPDPTPEDDGNVITSDNISENKWRVINNLIVTARKTLVKQISDALREDLAAIEGSGEDGNVIKTDNKQRVQELVEAGLEVITNGYKEMLEAIRSGNSPIYKEVEVSTGSKTTTSAEAPADPEGLMLMTEQPEPVAELIVRGVTEGRARKVVATLPANRRVMDQIEYADYLIAQDKRGRGKISNPAGFYIWVLEQNLSIPDDFETSSRQSLRSAMQQEQMAAQARSLAQRLQYEDLLDAEVAKRMEEEYPGERLEVAVKEQLRILKRSQAEWFERVPESTRREVALGQLRRIVRDRIEQVGLPGFVVKSGD